ncbi:DUF4124 domain-containing protein [Stenotrophomonas acidaminiphila]|uniref:DUF4124 domain-containing protein n=1 Tax=Stenotrophomonas acidaminiphila TaxID=128780 RepID=UPI001E31A98C|nr:DUF4124 domain-containing protein [Stenotrophomonas acidaminiphila]
MKHNKARIMPVIWRSSFVLASFTFAQNCLAQQVFKCVEKGKPDSYQSHPCASGQAAKAWDASPVAEPSNAELWRLYRMRQQLDRRYAADRQARASSYFVPGSSSSNACESAKRSRAAVYEAAGHHRSFALSSAYDNAVHDACK